MKQEEDKFTGLPENAFRELKAGEVYNPLMSPSKNYPEVNFWSVTWGIAMAILFSAAAAYLGLKVGQVFEAAIPIAIIAVGVSGAAKRKNALGENVIIQSIGACSGVIVAGAIFTLPALYILQVKYPEMTVSYPVSDSFPQIFRQRYARQISFPRSNRYYTGAGVRRKERQPGQTAVDGGNDRWIV